ncbi:hypothetical protein HCN44_009519 [Aphidius gifuensis]|uniref:Uncharacterized protein n=2 Tax=Aphidius gifuensis TaxID=684658 RepID=A0A834Y4U8_APHGI|nr:hypothetical protein HCN44_009519 [Aphidius gifuensis]
MSETRTSYTDWAIRAGVCGTIAFFGVPMIVKAVGFKSAGILAGSKAAGVMSAMATGGTTASGGVVASCQSIGAVGAIAKKTAVVIGLMMVPLAASVPSVEDCKPKASKAYDLAKSGAGGAVSLTKYAYSTHAPQVYELAKSGVNQVAIGYTSGGITAGSTAASMISVLGASRGTAIAAGVVTALPSIVGAIGAIANRATAARGSVDEPEIGSIIPETGAIVGAPIIDAQAAPNNQPRYADASTSTDDLAIDRSAMTVNSSTANDQPRRADASTSTDDLVTDRSAMTVNWSTANDDTSPNETPESRRSFWDILGQVRQKTSFKTVVGGLVVGAVAVVAAPVAVTAIGFTSGGIAAGSTAASMMSILGGGATSAGGVVATCQSIGAVGAISNTAAAAWGCAGAATTYVFGGNSAEPSGDVLDASTSVDDLDTDRSVVGVNWYTLENTNDSNTDRSVDRHD